MPRPFFPHTLHDVTHAVDGPFGMVVADLADGSLWVLKRDRKAPDNYTLSHYTDTKRSKCLERRPITGRREAVNAMAREIGLDERL